MGFDIPAYKAVIDDFHQMMQARAGLADARLAADKWTLKEMVGHLIDSASNNHQRFVRLQLEERLAFPAYDQERWKDVSRVAGMDYGLLVDLWLRYNEFLLALIERIDPSALPHVWLNGEAALSLDFLVQDYFRHMQWHVDLFEARAREIAMAGEG